MKLTLETILPLIIAHKYAILFPLMVVEGPLLTILGGFLSTPAEGYLNVWALFAVAVAADLTGDFFYYSLGRWGRRSVIFSWARRLGLSEHRFLKLEKHFDKHGGKTIAVGKIGHGLGWAAMLAAGVTRMNLLKFASINFLTSIFKTGALTALGYFYGKSYQVISKYFHYGGFIMSILLVTGLIFLIYYQRRSSRAA